MLARSVADPVYQRHTGKVGPQDHDQELNRERGGSNAPYLQRDSASVVQASQRAAGDQYQYQQRYQVVDPQYPADGQYPTPAAEYQMGGQQYQGPGQGPSMQHHQQQAMGGPPPPPLPAPVSQQQQWGPGGGGGGGARVGHGGAARLPNVDPESSAESDLMRGIRYR